LPKPDSLGPCPSLDSSWLMAARRITTDGRFACLEEPVAVSPAPSVEVSAEALILVELTDPAKLDTLKGKRAATPRLRKACYWIETARRGGETPEGVTR
jgi:hypothetical protein